MRIPSLCGYFRCLLTRTSVCLLSMTYLDRPSPRSLLPPSLFLRCARCGNSMPLDTSALYWTWTARVGAKLHRLYRQPTQQKGSRVRSFCCGYMQNCIDCTSQERCRLSLPRMQAIATSIYIVVDSEVGARLCPAYRLPLAIVAWWWRCS